MRSRMSKSYIEELRGIPNRNFDFNNNDQSNRSSRTSIQWKTTSLSLPLHKQDTKTICSSCQSTLSLRDIDLHSAEKNNQNINSPIVINPNELQSLTVDEIEKLAFDHDDETQTEQNKKPKTILKSSLKTNNRLTVPTAGDYCIRIPNVTSICEEQQQIEITETRLSDALGYLRMYENHNRIQFNSLQFNDREDLQILIDGPYGAPTQHIFEAEHAVLIAAGIGITPFASILQSIMCRYRNRRHKCPNCDYIWDNPQSEELCLKKVRKNENKFRIYSNETFIFRFCFLHRLISFG